MDAFEARPVTWLLSVAMLVAKVLLMLVIWVDAMDAFEARPVTWLLSVAILVANVLLMLVIWVVRVEMEASKVVGSKGAELPLLAPQFIGGGNPSPVLRIWIDETSRQLETIVLEIVPFNPTLLARVNDATRLSNDGGRGPTKRLVPRNS